MIRVLVQTGDFDAGAELAALGAGDVGGVASFTGRVRSDGGLNALTLEHYPAMTQKALLALAEQACTRWQLAGATIIHRVGRLVPGEQIVFVGTASAHRAAALEACAYLIDRLKTDAPFWKKEEREGGDHWVAAKASDDQAAARWQ
jgi:molybdopterin synthase catalytic subunit